MRVNRRYNGIVVTAIFLVVVLVFALTFTLISWMKYPYLPVSSSPQTNDLTDAVPVSFEPETEHEPDTTPVVYEEEKCPICWSEMQDDELMETNCGHLFHRHCLRGWLDQEDQPNSCPICRAVQNVDDIQ